MTSQVRKYSGMKKVLIIAAVVFIAAVIAVIAAAGLKWKSVADSKEKVSLLSGPELIRTGAEIRLGQHIACRTVFKAPWGISPFSAEGTAGEGSQFSSIPQSSFSKLGWGFNEWTVNSKIQPFREGEIPEGTLKTAFSNGQDFELKIPSFKVSPLTDADESQLALAEKIERRSKYVFFAIVGGLALVLMLGVTAVAFIIYFLMRRKAEKALTPWESALAEIRSLRSKTKEGKESFEASVSDLTDIVRRYLETRFKLRARRQTTTEFLSELDKGSSPLADTHKSFLHDFLYAADLVKFARLPADNSVFENAADKAEKLVTETVPAENDKGGAK